MHTRTVCASEKEAEISGYSRKLTNPQGSLLIMPVEPRDRPAVSGPYTAYDMTRQLAAGCFLGVAPGSFARELHPGVCILAQSNFQGLEVCRSGENNINYDTSQGFHRIRI